MLIPGVAGRRQFSNPVACRCSRQEIEEGAAETRSEQASERARVRPALRHMKHVYNSNTIQILKITSYLRTNVRIF